MIRKDVTDQASCMPQGVDPIAGVIPEHATQTRFKLTEDRPCGRAPLLRARLTCRALVTYPTKYPRDRLRRFYRVFDDFRCRISSSGCRVDATS